MKEGARSIKIKTPADKKQDVESSLFLPDQERSDYREENTGQQLQEETVEPKVELVHVLLIELK